MVLDPSRYPTWFTPYCSRNILKDDTDVPTTIWSKSGGETRRIQNHLLDWLVRLTKQSRFRVYGSVWFDTLITPITVLRDPDDDNRIYTIMSGQIDTLNNKIESGEFVEIGSDTPPTSSAFTNAYDSTEIS